MKKDPRLAKIAEWRNKATEEELKWIDFAWGWFDYNVNRELSIVENLKARFRKDLKSGEIFRNVFAWVVLDTSVEQQELKKRFGGTRVEDANGTSVLFSFDPPSLSRESRNQLSNVLGDIFELWEEGVLDKNLNHPRLKQCPECLQWFALRKTDQKYCTTDRYPPCREVASRGVPGEKRSRRERYLDSQRKKMEKLRERRKKDTDRKAAARQKDKLRDLKRRRFPTRSSLASGSVLPPPLTYRNPM